MTEATREQLMILVERVVRPIRTIRAQKKRMREDLWSHAVAAFEEELHESKDERAALSRVQDRLGNPHELTARLQKEVPRQCVFSYHFEQWLNARPGESMFSAALRQGFVAAFLPALIIVMASLSSNDRRLDNLACLLASMTTVTGTIILAFLFYIVRHALFLAPSGHAS